MQRYGWLAGVTGALILLVVGIWAVTRPEPQLDVRASINAAEALSGGDVGAFARAYEARPFVFPADHGAHPEYRTEWWYYTGNLAAADGRRFGFQFTIFRSALSDAPVTRTAALASNDVYMAHFALTDVAGEEFYAFERFSRGAAGLAGASGAPFRVFLEDWSVEGSGPEGMTMRLRAAEGPIALDLTATSTKPPTLQGDRGLSQKGGEPGNASYYYSLTRMASSGTITIEGQEFAVTGNAWMDHEWSTSALEEDAVGWDWFALQLADGRDITYFNIRRRDGGIDPRSSGSITAVDGTVTKLEAADVELEVLERWTSPRDAESVYPAAWRMRIPSADIAIAFTPQIPDQELALTVRYWEGSVRIDDGGYGYVELTGYGERDSRARGTP